MSAQQLEARGTVVDVSPEDRYLFERLARVDPKLAIGRQFGFEQLDVLLEGLPEDSVPAVEEALVAHLRQYKRSIPALYLVASIATRRGDGDADRQFEALINLLFDRKQWTQLRDVCEHILRSGEDPLALRRLAAAQEEIDPERPPVEIWERLSRVDPEVPHILIKLAKVYRDRGDKKQAAATLRQACDQARTMGYTEALEDGWLALLELEPLDARLTDEIEAYWLQRRKMDKAVLFLQLAIPPRLDAGKWSEALELALRIARHSPSEPDLRKLIKQILERRMVLEGGPPSAGALDALIADAGLMKPDVPVVKAVERLKTLLAFRVGDVVSHDSWGLGTVRAVDLNNVSADFQKKPGHTMSLELAVASLTRHDPSDLRVRLKLEPEKVKAELAADPAPILQATLHAVGGKGAASDFKRLLVPVAVPEDEWTSFWNAAKKVLDSDPRIVKRSGRSGTYELREEGSTERTDVETFNLLSNSEARYDWWMKNWSRIRKDRAADPKLLELLKSHFGVTARSTDVLRARQGGFSLLLLSAVRGEKPGDNSWQVEPFQTAHPLDPLKFVIGWLRDASADKTAELVSRLVGHPQEKLHEWAWDTYAELKGPEAPWSLAEARANEYWRKPLAFVRMAGTAVARAGEKLDRVLVDWGLPEKLEKVLSMDKPAPEIDEKVAGVKVKQILDFATEQLSDIEVAKRFMGLVPPERAKLFLESFLQNEKIEVLVRRRVLNAAIAMRPELDALRRLFERRTKGAPATSASEVNVIYVTQESYDRKSAELTELLEKKRWADAAALKRAAAHGDLRENPEYQAARDESARTSLRLQELQTALQRVRILEPHQITASAVAVGTRVKLREESGSEISYTFLGPWEADEAKGILSYQSPLVRQLLGKKVGDTVRVEQPDGGTADYTILAIEKAI